MATIKTQIVDEQRRIITQVIDGQRRVSCSCCEEEECCPYIAGQLGIGYLAEDLPDTLTFKTGFSAEAGLGTYDPPFVTATRSGETYITEPYTFTILGFSFTLTSTIIREFNNLFGIFEWGVITEGFGTPTLENGNPCLLRTIDGSIDNVEWRDDFLDTYTVNTYDEYVGGPPASTFTITRQELCLWSGINPLSGITELRYTTPNENTTRASMWTINNSGRLDGGPYNSPEGIYSEGNVVWEVIP